jgi:hypothetical protein
MMGAEGLFFKTQFGAHFSEGAGDQSKPQYFGVCWKTQRSWTRFEKLTCFTRFASVNPGLIFLEYEA